MVNLGYRAARVQGNLFRSIYRVMLPLIVRRHITQTNKISLQVYSFSCDRDLAEQVASIRSFIRHVGLPEQFNVISDGSYTEKSCQLLRQINPCVKVINLNDFIKQDLPKCVYNYADYHPLGKKLAVLMSIPVNGLTAFADSDILFFPGAKQLISLTNLSQQEPLYLSDCALALDDRLLSNESKKVNPVNSGFMLLQKPLDWSSAIEQLEKLQSKPNYFTEQTLVHLTMHSNHGSSLPSDRFVVKLDDQFIYQDLYKHQTALRHYVNPVRHKFWLSVMG